MAELLCFGPAGTGTVEFRAWRELFAPTRVRPVGLPGRETLLSSPALDDMPSLVGWLAANLEPPGEPFAMYGHSMGAWVAYELVHAWRERGRSLPTHLYVGARRAPHVPGRLPPLSDLPDAAFVEQIQARYGGIPEALLRKPAILQIFLPTLRADFSLIERYRHVERPPLDVPITAIRGLADPTVDRSDVAAWREHTTAGFMIRQVPGGHFFHREDAELLADALRI